MAGFGVERKLCSRSAASDFAPFRPSPGTTQISSRGWKAGLALLHLAKRLQVWHPIQMNDAMNLDRACWWRSF